MIKAIISYIKQDRRYLIWSAFFIGTLFLYSVVNQINGTIRSGYFILNMTWDGRLPFLPGMVYVYISWYIQLGIVAVYLFYLDYHKAHRQRQHTVRLQYSDEIETITILRFHDAAFLRLLRVSVGVVLVALAVFLVLPTWVERPFIGEQNGLAVTLVYKIYQLDYPTNAFPSLHVALAIVFAFFFCEYVPHKKYPLAIPLMLLWTILIVLSTVFIRQHYWPDLFAGIVLALLLVYWERFYSERH